MEVRWSPPAAERDNPEAAHRVARTIYDECARLKDFLILDELVDSPSDLFS
jgi:plasmid stabilization system protein ParE